MQLLSYVILISVIMFITLLHELGHLILAKMLNVPVSTFAVGFGPNLLSYEDKKKTTWCINLIPLGGYISISKPGESDVDTMLSIPPLKRLIVALGGPLVNIFTFFFIGSIFYNSVGPKSEKYEINKEEYVVYNSGNEYVYFNQNNGKISIFTQGQHTKKTSMGIIGHNPIGLKQGFYLCKYQLVNTTKKILISLSSLHNIKQLRSIIVAQKNIHETLQKEDSLRSVWITFLYYVMIFSLSIGLFNLLPIFGLDGGWVLISFINIFIKFNKKGERILLRTLNYGTIMLFLIFGLLIFRDILEIIINFFS